MIALIDYGAGNLTSVRKALSSLGAAFETPQSPGDCARASGVIVPGVGNFAADRVKVPHVGWNALEMSPRPGRLLQGLTPGAQVYFTHSYAAPVTDDCVAATTHADPFASAVERGNVFGVQFHPEKSSDAGLQILRNFLAVC